MPIRLLPTLEPLDHLYAALEPDATMTVDVAGDRAICSDFFVLPLGLFPVA